MDSSFQIPGYSIEAEIGRGGMATVYVAIQESLARTVALKIMSSQSIADSSAEERFLKEGKIVARLSHPNIVTVYDIGRVGAVLYMAMEYIEGGNLNDRILRGLSVADTYHIARQIAKALAYAHNRGFVHRDVKPANILFRDDGTAVLSDFGIAKAMSSETQLTAIGQTIGTPDYMSPEQVKGEHLDSRSDLYSLGVVIYETLTGEKPFKSDSAMGVAMKQVVAAPPQLPENLSIYQPLLDRLLAKEPGGRFSTAEQLIHTLDDLFADIKRSDATATVLMGQPSGLVDRSSVGRTILVRTGLRGRKTLLTVSLVALLIATGGSFYYWQTLHRVDPQTRKIINMLLTQAELQMQDSNLVEPAGVNAYQYFQNVLELDPDNEKALQGIDQIAGHFEAQARRMQQQEKYDEALALVEQGLEVSPHNSALLSLRKRLTAQRDEKRRWHKVAALLEQAARQVKAGRLLAPAGDNAYESYRSILGIDSGNKQALKGIWEIADSLEKWANAKRQQGLLDEAWALTEKGLQIDPQHKGLATLREELKKMLAEQQKQQRVARLLEQAQRQLEASHFTQPSGDNALESYRSVQSLDPGNSDATMGLQEIARHIEKEVVAARKQDRMNQALSLIEQGLQAVPRHAGLLEQRKEINAQIEHMRKQRRITDLLDEAERQENASHWIEPGGDNATASYRKVLAMDPHNATAQSGLTQIAERFEGIARQHRDEDELQLALTAANQGLKVLPEHAGLLSLRDELTLRLEAQRGSKELNDLLARADRQMAALKLTRPRGDSAYDSYTQALKISPQEERALTGLQRIADRYLELGQAELKNGALQHSLAMIERGLEVIPDHTGLMSLKGEVQLKAESQREEIKRLLMLAQQHVKAGRLVEEEGDDARKTYLRVLTIDPDNKEAADGLRLIAVHYETLAKTNHDAGAYREALVMVDAGLKADPNHQALKRLQKEILSVLGEVEDQNRQLAVMLADAQRKLEDGQFIRPEGDNAFEIYQEVLRLQPDNPLAMEGLRSMAGHFEAMAREKQQQGDLQQSLGLVEEGLRILPGHSGLLSLQSSLARQISGQSEQTREEDRPQIRRRFGNF